MKFYCQINGVVDVYTDFRYLCYKAEESSSALCGIFGYGSFLYRRDETDQIVTFYYNNHSYVEFRNFSTLMSWIYGDDSKEFFSNAPYLNEVKVTRYYDHISTNLHFSDSNRQFIFSRHKKLICPFLDIKWEQEGF